MEAYCIWWRICHRSIFKTMRFMVLAYLDRSCWSPWRAICWMMTATGSRRPVWRYEDCCEAVPPSCNKRTGLEETIANWTEFFLGNLCGIKVGWTKDDIVMDYGNFFTSTAARGPAKGCSRRRNGPFARTTESSVYYDIMIQCRRNKRKARRGLRETWNDWS